MVTPTPDEKNANRGTARGREALLHSLREHGAGRSILLDADGQIIAGNKTYAAARDLDLPVRIVRSDGAELIAVLREDLSLDDPDARALAYADNRVAELDLAWDPVQIAQDLADGKVDLSALWDDRAIGALLASLGEGDAPQTPILADRDPSPWLTWRVSFPVAAAGIVADTLRDLKEGLPELRWDEGE